MHLPSFAVHGHSTNLIGQKGFRLTDVDWPTVYFSLHAY